MAPNSQPYTTNQTKRPPPDASSNAEEQYVKTNIPIIAESSNSGVTYHLQIIDIRAHSKNGVSMRMHYLLGGVLNMGRVH